MSRRKAIGTGKTFVLDPDVRCKCGNHAVSFLEIHAVDSCSEEEPTVSAFLCKPCLDRDMRRAANIVMGGTTWCSSCFRPLVALSDLVVRVVPMAGLGK